MNVPGTYDFENTHNARITCNGLKINVEVRQHVARPETPESLTPWTSYMRLRVTLTSSFDECTHACQGVLEYYSIQAWQLFMPGP